MNIVKRNGTIQAAGQTPTPIPPIAAYSYYHTAMQQGIAKAQQTLFRTIDGPAVIAIDLEAGKAIATAVVDHELGNMLAEYPIELSAPSDNVFRPAEWSTRHSDMEPDCITVKWTGTAAGIIYNRRIPIYAFDFPDSAFRRLTITELSENATPIAVTGYYSQTMSAKQIFMDFVHSLQENKTAVLQTETDDFQEIWTALHHYKAWTVYEHTPYHEPFLIAPIAQTGTDKRNYIARLSKQEHALQSRKEFYQQDCLNFWISKLANSAANGAYFGLHMYNPTPLFTELKRENTSESIYLYNMGKLFAESSAPGNTDITIGKKFHSVANPISIPDSDEWVQETTMYLWETITKIEDIERLTTIQEAEDCYTIIRRELIRHLQNCIAAERRITCDTTMKMTHSPITGEKYTKPRYIRIPGIEIDGYAASETAYKGSEPIDKDPAYMTNYRAAKYEAYQNVTDNINAYLAKSAVDQQIGSDSNPGYILKEIDPFWRPLFTQIAQGHTYETIAKWYAKNGKKRFEYLYDRKPNKGEVPDKYTTASIKMRYRRIVKAMREKFPDEWNEVKAHNK